MKVLLIAILVTLVVANQNLKFKLMGEDSYTIADAEIKTHINGSYNTAKVHRFFVVGDFGDTSSYKDLDYVTDIMDSVSSSQKYDFIATVGDNVYENGIENMKKLDDANKIMGAFKKPNVKDIPMYLTLGNHDCYSDYKNEIKYSEYDDQWNMEDDYYELKFPLKDDSSKYLVLLMSNSCLLSCKTSFSENGKTDCSKMNVKVGGKKVKKHYEWIEKKLKKYSEDPNIAWLGIVMHHPVLLEPSLKEDLLPILRKYKLDMAIVGHKHMFEYANINWNQEIKYPGEDTGPVIDDCENKDEILIKSSRKQIFKKGDTLHQFMIGGSGRKFKNICPYKDQDGNVYFQNVKQHGMATVEADTKHFSVKYQEGLDKVIYEVIIYS